jgi:hypothetical protein
MAPPQLPNAQRVINATPLELLRRVVPRDVAALVYHPISDAPLPHVTPLYACKSTSLFERDLIYLKQNFDLVGHDEIVAHRFEGRPLPPRAAAISFDDGFSECFDVVRPLLLKHGVPCMFLRHHGAGRHRRADVPQPPGAVPGPPVAHGRAGARGGARG